jgi:hypothetical protein
MERIGRLKERYPGIARFYQIEVTQEKAKAKSITWGIERKDELEMRFSGSYYIRSDRTDLSEKELWELYMTLTNVEEAFFKSIRLWVYLPIPWVSNAGSGSDHKRLFQTILISFFKNYGKLGISEVFMEAGGDIVFLGQVAPGIPGIADVLKDGCASRLPGGFDLPQAAVIASAGVIGAAGAVVAESDLIAAGSIPQVNLFQRAELVI